MKTFNYMHENKKYKEMVVYIEACESGSMFENLLAPNISIYATTASNSTVSSYATYCDPKDLVFGKHIGTCLGDLYAVNFLENLESTDPSKETLQEQYEIIKNKTTESPVLQFGDMTIASEIIGRFEGNRITKRPLAAAASESEEENNDKYSSLVDSRYVKLHFLQSQHNKLQSQQSENALAEELNSIQRFDTYFQTFAAKFGLNVDGPVGHIDFTCLKARVAMYEKVCGTFSNYGLKYVRYLHYTCVQGVDIYDFEEALVKSCT